VVSAALNHAFRADTEAKWLTPDAPGLPQVFEDLREEVVEVVDIDRGAPGRPSARFRPGTCEAILLCDDVWLVTLSEEHDVSTEDAIRRVLGRLWRRGCRVLVDLSDVSFIASTTVGVVMDAYRRIGSSRMVVVAPPGSRAARTFELAGVDGHLPLFPDRLSGGLRLQPQIPKDLSDL
jgi:anti-anti-sigma factor